MAFSGWKRMLGRKSRFENAAASDSTASHKESGLQSKQTPKQTYFENSVPDTPSISNAESSRQGGFPLRQEHESLRSKSSSAQNYLEASAPSQTTLTSQLENHISHLTLKIESSAPAPRTDSQAEYRQTGSFTESTEFSRLRQLTAPLGTSSETTSTIKGQLSSSITLNPDSDSGESYASAQSDDSDASDDSTILRQRESIRQQKITPPQEECKLALAKALEATDKVLANKLADKLALLLEGNHEKMPEIWNMDLAKLALNANCLPRPDIVTYVSAIGKGGLYQGRTVPPNLQIEALFIEGVLFLKVQNYTKAIKSFKRGYKLARQIVVPGQASDFIKILITTYEISGGPSEEVEVYTALLPKNYQPTPLFLLELQHLTATNEGGISPTVSEQVQDFLVVDSLRWIEAMGVMQSSGLALFMIRELERIYDNNTPKVVDADSEIIIRQIKYICKFLEQYNTIIDETPLQLHYLNLFLRFEQHLPQARGNLSVAMKIHDPEDQVSIAKRLESEFQEFLKIGYLPTSGGLTTNGGETPTLTFSPDCRRLAYSKPDAEVVIVKDLAFKDSSMMLITREKYIWDMSFAHEGGPLSNILALATRMSILLWDLTKNEQIRRNSLDLDFDDNSYKYSSNMLEFSTNNRCLGVLAGNNVFVLDVFTGSMLYRVNIDYIFIGFTFSHNGEYAVTLDNRGVLHKISSTSHISDITKFPQIDRYGDAGITKLSQIKCLPNEIVLAWHCWDTVVHGVTMDGKSAFSFKDIQFQASLAVSRSQRRFAIASRDSIIIGNIPDGEQVQSLKLPNNRDYGKILASAFFPSGDFLITVSGTDGLKCHKLTLDLKVEDRWVVRGNEPLLWIPPNYHAMIVSPSKSNCVLFTHLSGHSIEISFTLGRHEMLVRNRRFPGKGNNTSTRERPPPVDSSTLPPLIGRLQTT
ncbi:hypothetical protein H072_7378 [Dactylellina haptotyla CBS 200.50]|uniref:Uncharacterized protein n=1 Tax=Dactylellina haptotyla (strain CBS 200.50) TaxID=1284197 RepID=S8A7S0_DACHA|nr:hypothetical protein H072_7378 [Dactylellina haptotyla CBS 200.50]